MPCRLRLVLCGIYRLGLGVFGMLALACCLCMCYACTHGPWAAAARCIVDGSARPRCLPCLCVKAIMGFGLRMRPHGGVCESSLLYLFVCV